MTRTQPNPIRPEHPRATSPAPWTRPARTPRSPGLAGLACLATLGAVLLAGPAWAASPLPEISLKLAAGQAEPQNVSVLLQILFLLTILSLAPSIVLCVTSFTRIIIVFSFLRQAMGTQQLPPTQVLAALAIFMTIGIMTPVAKDINENALQPYLAEKIGFNEALAKSEPPIRAFLFKHTREKDLSVFYSITKTERPKTKEEVPIMLLVAGFMISELKTGFTIGFLIYIPFLILDMVVSSILLAMGMMMMPPAMVSLPFKLLLFVMVDGWNLLTGSLVNSFS
jgi:flagellar biosynthetic protein FliP